MWHLKNRSARGNRTRSLDLEERALAHASEMWHLKTCCARGNRTRSLDLEERALHMPARCSHAYEPAGDVMFLKTELLT